MNAVNSSSTRIAISTHKGGVGKTTTAVNLAAGLVREGLQVLLLDLDPQGNASYSLGSDSEAPTLWDTLQEALTLPQAVQKTGIDGLDLIAADSGLSGAEPLLRSKVGGETWLRRQVERLPKRWDVILYDTPPGLGMMTISALASASHVLVPVEPHVLGLAGVADVLGTLEDVREALNPDLELLGILPVKVDRRNRLTNEVLKELREQLDEQQVLPLDIRINVKLAEAPGHAQPIFDYAPHSAGAEDYGALAQEVLKRAEIQTR